MRSYLKMLLASAFLFAAFESAALAQSADLKITASGSASEPSVSYSVTVKNKGPSTATGIVVTGGIQGGAVFSVGSSGWTCTITGDSFTCTRTNPLVSGASSSFGVAGQLPPFGQHPMPLTYSGGHFEVTGNEDDPVGTNNYTSVYLNIPENTCSGCGPGQCAAGYKYCAYYGGCISNASVCPDPACRPNYYYCPSRGLCIPVGTACNPGP